MKITKLTLENYKGFKTLDLNFDSQLNVFVGVNGAGKSTVLEALKLSLSWLVNRISREKANGLQLPKADIHNGSTQAFISLTALYPEMNGTAYQWTLTQSNAPTKEEASYKEVTLLARQIWKTYKNEATLPVIQVYPVSRVVEQISPDTIKEGILDLAVYDNALTGKTNYQSFFEWFRYQDDILNERISTSQTILSRSSRNLIITQLTKLIKLEKSLNLDNENYYQLLIDLINRESSNRHVLAFMYVIYQNTFVIDNVSDSLCSLLKIGLSFDKVEALKDISLTIKTLNADFKDIKKHTDIDYNIFIFSVFIITYANEINQEYQTKIHVLIEALNSDNFSELSKALMCILERDLNEYGNKNINQGKELKFVRKAIELFIPEYQNLQVKREPEPRMELTKNGKIFNLNQLSDGEKNLIALIGDIARRLTMGNPALENPLHGQGIIIIDEIDMHLHPKWQRMLSEKLTQVFPGCQFFLSTHSPQVISHIQEQSIVGLKNVGGGIETFTVNTSYGKNTDRILEDIMDVSSKPEKIQKKLDLIFDLISRDELTDAQEEILQLKSAIGEDGDLIKAATLIKRKKMIGR